MPKFYPIASIRIQAQVALAAAGNDAQREHALAATLIGVLVRNLIDNALRYSPDQAQVLVSVTRESGQTVLSVQDSGAGMTAPEMARLGERFLIPPCPKDTPKWHRLAIPLV